MCGWGGGEGVVWMKEDVCGWSGEDDECGWRRRRRMCVDEEEEEDD